MATGKAVPALAAQVKAPVFLFTLLALSLQPSGQLGPAASALPAGGAATTLAGAPVSRMDWPGPALLLATGYGLVLSHDGGQTFTGAGESLPRGEMKAFVLSTFFAVDPVAKRLIPVEGFVGAAP